MDISIMGHSDDLIHIFAIDDEGNQLQTGDDALNGGDEFNHYAATRAGITVVSFKLTQPDETGAIIHVMYDGIWTSAVSLLEEGVQIPEKWTVGFSKGHAYSTQLIITDIDPKSVLVKL